MAEEIGGRIQNRQSKIDFSIDISGSWPVSTWTAPGAPPADTRRTKA
jgi:hypothetical protein